MNHDPLLKPKNWEFAKDIFVIHAILKDNGISIELTVNSGSLATIQLKKGINHHEVKFNDQAGDVKLLVRKNGRIRKERFQPTSKLGELLTSGT